MEVLTGWVDRERGQDVVTLLHRDSDGELKSHRSEARWSFWLAGCDDEDRQTLQRFSAVTAIVQDGDYLRVDCTNRWERRKLAETIHQSLLDRSISGTVNPDAEVCEADVGPLRRIFSDVEDLTVSTDHRAVYLDIEVDSRLSIEQQREGRSRVLSWALAWDTGTEVKHTAAVLKADTDAAERELLERLLKSLDHFDLVLAWFGAIYDFEVITRRCVRLDARLHDKTPIWNRWCWLDAAEVFRKYNMSAAGSGDEKQSMALNEVAHRLLGEGKHDFDSSRTWEAWEAGGSSRLDLVRYNIQDTRLLPLIERKTGYVELHREVCRICNLFPHTQSLKATQQGDGYLLKLGASLGRRWPSIWRDEDTGSAPFEGAYVMEPTRRGIVEGVSVADFAGLYPSIMRSWNMSPETVLGGSRILEAESKGVPLARLPARPTAFRTDVEGMLPIALDELQAKRDTYKHEMKVHSPGSREWRRAYNLSSAFKIVINSFYGIVGSPWSRFFNRPVAEGVTTTGAWLIKTVVKRASARGFDPFYGDTDSIFVRVEDPKGFQALVDELNEDWPRLLAELGARRSEIELDYEKRFRRMVMVKAKRYAAAFSWYKGKDADPEAAPEVKGLEFKRGDTLRIARQMQEQVIGLLLRNGPVPDVDELREFIEVWKRRVYEDATLDDLVMSQSIKALGSYSKRYTSAKCKKPCGYDFGDTDIGGMAKCPDCGTERKRATPPPHVRVALMLVERGVSLNEGDRVAYFVLPTEDGSMNVAPAVDVSDVAEVDLDYYWLKRILPATARVLETVYPEEPWMPTAAQRREVEKARLIEANRGKIDDLPLFQGVEPDPAPAPAPAPVPLQIRTRTRSRKKVAEKRQSEGPRCVVRLVESLKASRLHLRSIQSTAQAYPGPLPLVLEIETEPGTVVEMPTHLTVASTIKLREALERIGATVTGLPGGR